VAELGLRWAREKGLLGEADLEAALVLGRARVAAVRAAGLDWLLPQVAASRFEHLRELIDAPYLDVRSRAVTLMRESERFRDEIALWQAMSESPYGDVQEWFVRHLSRRAEALGGDVLRHVWATALLAIHRGGRAKRQVVNDVADRVIAHPGEADALLPLLSIALRSVRPPERRSALAALCRAAFHAPSLRASIARGLPELKLFDEALA
jgi:hypothetical protein